MNLQATTRKRLICPSCGSKGKRVGLATLRALLKDEFVESLAEASHSCDTADGCKPLGDDTGWRFCESSDCDVVYFSEEGDTTFTKPQLKVAVGVKEKGGERPLCYCFGHSVASLKDQLRTEGRSEALEEIRAKMKDPGCRCETENPSGSCCLGSVTKGIRIAQEELEMAGADVKTPEPLSQSSTSWGEKIAKIGTIVSAIVASGCCWLPLLLLAVGVSGVGIAATLEAFRPLFIVVTFGFLAAAFYFTYRPRKARGDAGHACCAPEASKGAEVAADCCAPSGKRRFSIMAMNKIMLWVVTVLAVIFLLFPQYVGFLLGTAGGDGRTGTENMNRAVVKVEGMTCEGCAALVERAIRSVPSVLSVEVSYEKGEAAIGTDECCPVPREQILAALEKAGYRGSLIETDKQAVVSTEACCPFPEDEILKAVEDSGFSGSVADTK
ncbi:MAG: mercuric transporter MerT family protein [Actinomycetota bacterium]